MTKSNTRRFVGAAWSLLWFQLIASAGAVAVTAWAVMEVSPRLAQLRAETREEPVPPATTAENKGAGAIGILGEAAMGASLLAQFSADPEGPGSALSYQWLRDGAAVDGATAQVYQTTADDAGRNISVRVDYVDGAGFSENVTSASIAIPPPVAQPPSDAQPPAEAAPPYAYIPDTYVRLQPSFGSIDLRAGAEQTRDVRAGGAYDAASRINATCRGYITAEPSFSLRYTAGGLPLNIGVNSQMDTTIAVRAPDGSWHCSDDTDGVNPRVSWESPSSGEYQIWVGRYGVPNDPVAGTLYISHHRPGVIQ